MRNQAIWGSCCMRVLLGAMVTIMMCTVAYGDVSLLGVQYQEDDLYTEYNCIWEDDNYPTSCPTPTAGANVHVYIKNDGESAVTFDDVMLEQYHLPLALEEKILGQNICHSIYFKWDVPSDDIMNAGEPIWYKCEPASIAAGDVGHVVIRLRSIPSTDPITITVDTSANTITPDVDIDNTQPELANIGFSPDLDVVTLHWRRSDGTAPATIKMDGVDVTSDCTTVNDTDYDFAVTKLELDPSLSYMSYHVFEGIYSDSESAIAGVRAWVNPFNYGTYGARETETTQDAKDWIDTCEDRGVNCLISNNGSGGLIAFLRTSAGQQYAIDRDYGFVIDVAGKWNVDTPRMWYLREEAACHDAHVGCGTGLLLPCDYEHHCGVLAQTSVEVAAQRQNNRLEPTVTVMDGAFRPYNYCVYGQLSDVLGVDPYYQMRTRNAYWTNNNRIPLYEQADYIYAVSRIVTSAAEPKPTNIILQANEYHEADSTRVWPFADPECKRIEAYYALAAGAKGMGYWWFLSTGGIFIGLGDDSQDATDLWDEIGLLGNEFKCAQPLIVTSHPLDDLDVTGTTDVWVKGLASGTDTLLLVAVNDDYYIDSSGITQISDVTSASVTVTLPTWMQSPTPSAFEISCDGVSSLSSSIDGEDMTITIGTLKVSRLIVVTTDSTKQATYKERYLDECWGGICTFASGHCLVPGFSAHPSSDTIGGGGTAVFEVTAGGAATLTYQWQKDDSDLSNGGHYSGVTTNTLTVSSASSADEGDYHCVVTNSYDNATSDDATLTVTCGPAILLQNGDFADGFASGVADDWTTYVVGGATPTFLSANGNPNPGQRGDYTKTRDTRYYGIYQTVNAQIGDAFTFTADVWCMSNSNLVNCSLRVDWDGGTSISGASQVCNADQPNQTWTQMGYGTGVATGTSVTLFVDVRSLNDSNQDTDTYWDNITSYRAHLPPAPTVTKSTTSSTALKVDVDEGCNLNNSNAQYAISIGGGAYTLDTHFVQADGTVSTTAVWQTDSTWGNKAVTGLTTDTEYTFKVKARYSSTYTQATSLGNGAAGTPSTIIVITTQPDGESLCAGETASFTVAATGEGSLSYQWQQDESDLSNGGDISGVTTTTLTIVDVDSNDEASYRCVVTDTGGSVASEEAGLVLKSATSVTQDPSAQDLCAGSTAEFFIYATGEGALTYQWQKDSSDLSDGGDLSGTKTSVLTIENVENGDADSYRCIVTGDCGSDTSSTAALTLKDATTITDHPDADSVCSGATATFTVTATGEGSLTYQWQQDQSDLSDGGHYSGVTTATLTVSSADSGDEADYRCVVTGECGSANSNEAALSLTAGTAVTEHPSAQDVCAGATAQFTVTASGSNLAYQWQKTQSDLSNGGDLSGVTTATLSIANVDSGDIANYRCVVTGDCGSPASNEAGLTLKDATSITGHPSVQDLCAGATAQFTVSATGEGSLSYQWQADSSDLSNGGDYSGVTTATLTISNVEAGDAADYRCVVTGECGSANSNEAALTLKDATTITDDPDNETVEAGGIVQFTVAATGEGSLTYQWQQDQSDLSDGGDISGVTTVTLTIANADAADEADYRCVVTGDCGSANSNEASLTINVCLTDMSLSNGDFEGGDTGGVAASWTSYSRATVPTFIAYTIPIGTAPTGGGDQFQQIQTSYVASGGAGVYQVLTGCTSGDNYTISGWMRTNSAYGRATVKCAAAGSTTYGDAIDLDPAASTTSSSWVVFSGTVEATGTSITIFLDAQTHVSTTSKKTGCFDSVIVSGPDAPIVTGQPSAQDVCSGATAQFTVTATGSSLSYQWQKTQSDLSNGGDLSGVTTATLSIANVEAGDAANYRCVVTNACDSATSSEAALTLKDATAITDHPDADNICTGGTATFTVAATGEGSLTYQWQKTQSDLSNGGDLSGVTTATLSIANVEAGDAANYRCVVDGDCGSVNSNEAALTLKDATTITDHPDNAELAEGETATFTVAATGEGSVTYQWQKDSSDLSNGGGISGVTTTTLTIEDLESADEGNYRCVVTADCGSANSNAASLDVCLHPSIDNAGFEDGFTGSGYEEVGTDWTSYVKDGEDDIRFTQQDYQAPEGTYYQQIQVRENASYGGIYQTITGCESGQTYTISGSYRTNTTGSYATVSVLVDTNGGTDRDSAEETLSSKSGGGVNFTTFSEDVTTTGTSITIFLDMETSDSSAFGKAGCFDNLTIVCNP